MLRKRAIKIAVDVALLVGFVTEFITREGPDYALHSWVGIVLILIITIHLLSNTTWIKRVLRRGRDDPEFSLGVLNAILGSLAVVCIATGFPIWLEWSDAEAWEGIHTITGMASILIMFVHLWRNRARIKVLARRRAVAA